MAPFGLVKSFINESGMRLSSSLPPFRFGPAPLRFTPEIQLSKLFTM
jgi:hypothetical protein